MSSLSSRRKAIAPLAFLLVLAGVAAYLKSFLPVKLEAREAQQASKDDKGDQSDPASDDIIAAAAEEAQEELAAKSAERKIGSSDKVVPIRIAYDNDENLTYGSSAIEPARPLSLRVATVPIGDPIRPINDNRSSAQSGSGGSGSSGGGGGGGGGQDRPTFPRNPDPAIVASPEPDRNRAPRTSGPVHLQDVVGCQVFMISMRPCWPEPPMRMATG